MAISEKYIQYGVSSEIALDLAKKKISLTTFKNTSAKNLIDKYDLELHIIEFVKNCIIREPIPEETIQLLLDNSNYVCCLCKSNNNGYIIHHIVEYSINQDNSYANLAVLCPNHHDFAHRQGIALTNRITVEQIIESKRKWENEVQKKNDLSAKLSKSEFDNLDLSKIYFQFVTVLDNKAKNVKVNHLLTTHTKFLLKVSQEKREQEFIVYLSIITNEGDQKWIGFGTPIAINNVFNSERVFRIGKPGYFKYQTIENILEKVRESGLVFKGIPVKINTVRLWGWHNNTEPLEFEFSLID